jgi:hypothetical protein
MPDNRQIAVQKLTIDRENYRTVRQASEAAAVEAMVSTRPDWFWALMDSLLQDGYLPTENIIVLRSGPGGHTLTVKEGNRRIAALKLIHGYLPANTVEIPDGLRERLDQLEQSWFDANKDVPCSIYPAKERAIVDRIVRLAHGKGEKAGRDHWNAVARARHNREENQVSEPALDLLEKYVEHGKNLTHDQATRWAGEYPLSVLAEVMKRLAPRLGLANAPSLAAKYPNLAHRSGIEDLLRDVGIELIGFTAIRNKGTDFAAAYGIPALPPPAATPGPPGPGTGLPGGSAPSAAPGPTGPQPVAALSGPLVVTPASGSAAGLTPAGPGRGSTKTASVADPKAVKRQLKKFAPRGNNRGKVVALRDEAVELDLGRTPLAFCFLLRSMFEISGKAYCTDHTLRTQKKGGGDKSLLDLLRMVTNHLTTNMTDNMMKKELHGALTELGRQEGILSVTSLNQLIHNPAFSVTPTDISILFGNVFPLLKAMNA